MNMRLFIALDLPEEIRKRIKDIIDGFDKEVADIGFTDPDNIHITLKFLGELREDGVKQCVNHISEVVKHNQPYKLQVSGFGFFGTPNFIRILWLGISEGKSETIKIMKDLNVKLDYIKHEDYYPSPHLTIGRVRKVLDKEGLLNEINRLANVKIGEVDVNNINLKKSVLSIDGPIYTDIESFKLGH